MQTLRIVTLSFAGFVLLGASAAMAGSCHDPWVTSAIEQVMGRAPNGQGNSGECNIYLYNNGSWNSRSALISYVRNRFYGQCRDPWVTSAVTNVMGRAPHGVGNSGECNIYRYGHGQWSSYSDLTYKVKVAFGLVRPPQINTQAAQGAAIRNGVNASQYMRNTNGGSIISRDGAGVITAGGANVITAGGANMAAHGNGN